MNEPELLALLDDFNRAWNDHDLDAAMAFMTEDCVFDTTSPAPDGHVYEGKQAVRAAWAPIFDNPQSRFEGEETFAAADRLVQRWVYSWGDGHIRGVDVIHVRDGLISAKLSYVKG